MQGTEQYLNTILQKRMGSVPNYGGISKNGGTVVRLPQKEQKIQAMPTVFRTKHQSVYRASQIIGQENRSSVVPLRQQTQLLPKKRQSTSKSKNQRVQYGTISRRIQNKQQQITTPTTDISHYRQSQYISPVSVEHSHKIINRNTVNQMENIGQKRMSISSQQVNSKPPKKMMQSEQNINNIPTIHQQSELEQSRHTHQMSKPPLARTTISRGQETSQKIRKRIFQRSSEKKSVEKR